MGVIHHEAQMMVPDIDGEVLGNSFGKSLYEKKKAMARQSDV